MLHAQKPMNSVIWKTLGGTITRVSCFKTFRRSLKTFHEINIEGFLKELK